MAHRSPKELIQLYWTEVWNNRNAEMIRELCADPIIRHDPGSTTPLSVEDQIARVRQQSEKLEPYFEHEVLHADDEYVTSVWNMSVISWRSSSPNGMSGTHAPDSTCASELTPRIGCVTDG